MTLTVTTEWLEAVTRADARIVFLFSIYDGVTEWKALSASSDVLDYPVGVKSVSGVGAEIDPITRDVQVSECSVVCDDSWIRPIVVGSRIKGKRATVKVGAAELAEDKFVGYFVGPIDTALPDGLGDEVTVEILDGLSMALEKTFSGYWEQSHPLEVIDDVFSDTGTSSTLIDATSFDPDQAAYDDISHFVVSRSGFLVNGEDSAVRDPEPAIDTIRELARMMYGTLRANEDGEATFSLFDASASAERTWVAADILEFKQIASDENAVNRVTMSFKSATGTPEDRYSHNDTASQSSLAYPGESERVIDYRAKLKWSDKVSELAEDITTGAITSADICMPIGMCGTNTWRPTGSQPARFKISAARPLYLMIEREIWKVTGITLTDNSGQYTATRDDGAESEPVVTPLPSYVTLTGVTRAQFGTSDPVQTYRATTKVIDVTMLVYMAQQILKRGSYGVSLVEVTTAVDQYEIQIGDLVSIESDKFLGYSMNGTDSSDKWEVISKEPDFFASPSVIRWKLALATSPAITETGSRRNWGSLAEFERWERAIDEGAFVQGAWIDSGFAVSDASAGGTAKVDITAGVIGAYPYRGELLKDITLELENSTDNYIGFDPSSNGVFVNSVNSYKPPRCVWLAKVTTGVGTVTTIDTTVSETTALDAVKLVDNTVDTLQVADYAIGGNQTFADSMARNNNFDFAMREDS